VSSRPQSGALRAVIASTVGTTIEWYDFYIYGLVAALVFDKVFFPKFDPYAGTLLAFSTYFVGFAARPLGALIFGHFGDRIGRKTTLVSTLLIMGLATSLVGLVPGYGRIGIWGAVAVALLRIVQGFGVGGEWAGSVAMATEWSGFGARRGLMASWPQLGSPLGLLIAIGVLVLIDALGGANEAFLTWGWRIPFLFSIVLIGIGLWIRLGVEETPVFASLVRERKIVRRPVVDVLIRRWRDVALTCLIRTGQQAAFVLFTTFLLSYATSSLGLPRRTLLLDLLIAACVSLVTTPLFSALSDRFGRKRVYLIGTLAMAAWAFPYFALIDSKLPVAVLFAVVASLAIHDIQYGPQAAFIAEAFPANLRYSGASLGYHLAAVTSGGPAPLIATYLLHTYRSSGAIAVYLVVIAVIGAVTTVLLPDRAREDYDRAEERVITVELDPRPTESVA
jgi:MFS family permease